MQRYLLIILLLLKGLSLAAQTDMSAEELKRFNQDRVSLNRDGLYALGAWSVGNMAISGAGWAVSKGSDKYFHMGNVLWNTVNLAIAVPGIVGSYKDKGGSEDAPLSIKKQRGITRTYLINFGLDFAYIGSGIALWEFGKSRSGWKHSDKFNGFGQSLLMQGGFLLLFDATMYSIHAHHGIKLKGNTNSYLGFTGNGFRYQLSF